MSALMIIDFTPIDPERMKKYSSQAAQTLLPFGAEFIAKGELKILKGETGFANKAVIKFPDIQSAQDWYHSEDYQRLTDERDQAMHSQFHLIVN